MGRKRSRRLSSAGLEALVSAQSPSAQVRNRVYRLLLRWVGSVVEDCLVLV